MKAVSPLDYFGVVTRGGIVLYSDAPVALKGDPVNELIRTIILEERSENPWLTGQYVVRWEREQSQGLLFVAVYQKVVVMNWMEEAMLVVREAFLQHLAGAAFDLPALLRAVKDKRRDEVVASAPAPSSPSPISPTSPATPTTPISPTSATSTSSPGKRVPRPFQKKESGKDARLVKKPSRVWDDPSGPNQVQAAVDIAEEEVGRFDLDNLYDTLAKKEETASSKKGGIWAFLESLAGGVELSDETLAPVLGQFREHLVGKNVAHEIADELCESVRRTLRGTKPSQRSAKEAVRAALAEALTTILTPSRSINLLRDVQRAKDAGRPFVIVFIGVNGVGKSTNLAKVGSYLKQNGFSVLVAGCDTFRAGAVEQLRVHTSRLGLPLFHQGYGKDAAHVAQLAIKEARRDKQDVVLVDTAGRMQDNAPLMKSLAKLISLNQPDLILFVGEALVGNEAVDQLSQFNRQIVDHTEASANPRAIDAIILTKFDTIDDKVGAAVSMVKTTGQPILFVGVGQHYTDLKRLNVQDVINTLLN